jgi:hypothetical protein
MWEAIYTHGRGWSIGSVAACHFARMVSWPARTSIEAPAERGAVTLVRRLQLTFAGTSIEAD